MSDQTYLTGHLLIAMPAMQDPNFVKTVTYICEHSDQGALGIVINRPLGMDLGTIFDQLALESADPALARQPVLQGGPVHQERGFVLHEPADAAAPDFDATVAVTDAIRVTTSQDILTAMARGDGPKRAVVALGYAGWGAGQLESELAQGSWFVLPAEAGLVFAPDPATIWDAALARRGIEL